MISLPKTWAEKIQQVVKRGTPDFLCCINGTFVAIELKVDAKLERLQEYKLKLISEAGGLGLVVTPDNWDLTYEFLHTIAIEGLEKAKQIHH